MPSTNFRSAPTGAAAVRIAATVRMDRGGPSSMPIYEYRCEACEHRFETLVRGAETPVCPTCGSATLAREFSTFAVSTGGTTPRYSASPAPCGTCGDPRGPGSCAMN